MTSTIITATSAYPYSAIVRVLTTFSDGSRISGSGVIVGDNDVLTAAHMVYDGKHGVAQSILVLPGLSGSTAPFGAYAVSSISYLAVDQDGDGKINIFEAAHDFALLGFTSDIDNATGRFVLAQGFVSGIAVVDGYPGNQGGNRLVQDSAPVSVSQGIVNTARLDINPGNSGGPVWVVTASGPAVVGIVSTDSWAGYVGGAYSATIQGWIAANNTLLTGSGGSVIGGAGNDTLIANARGGLADGLGGNDFVEGGAGNDTLYGGAGSDTLYGFDGRDLADGGDGNDNLNGHGGNDTLAGGAGNDTIAGGNDQDLLAGGDGPDTVNGNQGNDTVSGGTGNDLLFGGAGNDSLAGDAGNDTLAGDLGNDTLTGGAGSDLFQFAAGSGRDRITDFSFAEGDRLQLPRGTAYTLGQATDGAAMVSWGSSDSVVLAGITRSSVTAGWIVFG